MEPLSVSVSFLLDCALLGAGTAVRVLVPLVHPSTVNAKLRCGAPSYPALGFLVALLLQVKRIRREMELAQKKRSAGLWAQDTGVIAKHFEAMHKHGYVCGRDLATHVYVP